VFRSLRVLFLPLICLLLAVMRPAVAANDTPANGNYLGSRLVASQPQGTCPPDISPFYQAYEIVTGTDMRQRPWGFARTLREVLVKVSGDPRLKDDPRTAPLTDRAADFVACFGYADQMADIPLHDEQGTYDRPYKLTVTFDPGKIDALLATFGDKPWRGARPGILPVLLVRGPKPPPYLLSTDEPRAKEQRAAFIEAAGQFGIRVLIPNQRLLGDFVASIDHFKPAPAPPYLGNMLVSGTLEWNETLPGWIGNWATQWDHVDHRWGIRGVNYDAAFRDIVAGVELIASGNGSPDPDHAQH